MGDTSGATESGGAAFVGVGGVGSGDGVRSCTLVCDPGPSTEAHGSGESARVGLTPVGFSVLADSVSAAAAGTVAFLATLDFLVGLVISSTWLRALAARSCRTSVDT